MQSRAEKIIVSLLFLGAGIYFLAGGAGVSEPEEFVPAAVETPRPADAPPLRREWEKVVYTCRLGREDVPAVQISQVESADGQTAATIARVAVEPLVAVAAPRAAPVWDYRAVSARSGASRIAVLYDPAGARDGDEWILELEDARTAFRARVRDCQEISDE